MPIVFLSFLSFFDFFLKNPLHCLFLGVYSKHRTNETTTTTEKKTTLYTPLPVFLCLCLRIRPKLNNVLDRRSVVWAGGGLSDGPPFLPTEFLKKKEKKVLTKEKRKNII